MFCKQKGYLEEELDYRKQALDQAYMVKDLCWPDFIYTAVPWYCSYISSTQYMNCTVFTCSGGVIQPFIFMLTANPGIGSHFIQCPAAG